MSEKKVISIRFSIESNEDMELYARLEQEAGKSASLASVVKARVKASYEKQELVNRSTELFEQIAEVIRTEIQESSMKAIGTLLSNTDEVKLIHSNTLPEKSEELPIGALDFLE